MYPPNVFGRFYLNQWDYVFHLCAFVARLVCQEYYTKSTEQISPKLGWGIGLSPELTPLTFVTNADKGTIQNLFLPFFSSVGISSQFCYFLRDLDERKSGVFSQLVSMREFLKFRFEFATGLGLTSRGLLGFGKGMHSTCAFLVLQQVMLWVSFW